MFNTKERGFTLVELLVVIAIIGILAGAILLAINPARLLAESRDAQRVSDLDTVARALNLALADQSVTLTACTTGCDSASGSQAVDGTGWVTFTPATGELGLSRYMAALPVDPRNEGTSVYRYQADADDQTFELNAVLEANLERMTTDGGNDENTYEVGTAPGLTLLSPTP